MNFERVVVNDLTYSDGDNDRDEARLLTFFREHYDEVANDVFPDPLFHQYYNPLVIKVTDRSGRVVGGLLSCAPPALIDQALTLKDSASFKRLMRLTFLDMIAVDAGHPEVYRILIRLYLKTVKDNGFKNILGYTKRGTLHDELVDAGFVVMNPYDVAPPLQGGNWVLPPSEDPALVSWFYKVHPL